MSNTRIKKPEVDMGLAAMVLNMGQRDLPTASYITGCLLLGMALKILHEAGRDHDEILLSTEMTLENLVKLENEEINKSTTS